MSEPAALKTKTTKAPPGNSPALLVQRKCACGGSSGLTGSCSDCEKKKLLGQPLQTKLRVDEPGDEYEQEADRVAEQVMRMAEPGEEKDSSTPLPVPLVQRTVGAGRRQVKDHSVATSAALPIVHDALASSGTPLDVATRDYFEPSFGHDFSSVRVHTDSRAQYSAAAVGSRAYALENDIVFAPLQYSPATTAGKRLLAHELAHVTQQRSVSQLGVVQRKGGQGQVIIEVVDDEGYPVAGALVFLIPEGFVGSMPGVPVDARGQAHFEVAEGRYDLAVDVPDSKCFAKRYIPKFSVAANTTQGKVVRLRNHCVA